MGYDKDFQEKLAACFQSAHTRLRALLALAGGTLLGCGRRLMTAATWGDMCHKHHDLVPTDCLWLPPVGYQSGPCFFLEKL